MEAAGLGLVGSTAIALSQGVQKDQLIFVNGGSSSVAQSLIPILKKIGAKVIATASGPKIDAVKAKGADAVIDCRSSVEEGYTPPDTY